MKITLSFYIILFLSGGVWAQPPTHITNAKGQTIKGTIIKVNTDSITFRKNNGRSTYVIKKDSLSKKTQEELYTTNPSKNTTPEYVTKITPGKEAFLAIPFETQERHGICAAASAMYP